MNGTLPVTEQCVACSVFCVLVKISYLTTTFRR